MGFLANHAAIGRALFGRGPDGSAPFVGPLDAFTTGLTWAGSFKRKLLASHNGDLFTVHSSAGGNPTASIGALASGAVDESSLLTFASSNSVYAASLIDQVSGDIGNLTQATLANRPRIVNAGTIESEGGAFFDGGGDCCLASGNIDALDLFSASSAQVWARVRVHIDEMNGRLFVLTGNETGFFLPFVGAVYWDFASPFTGRITASTPPGIVDTWADISVEKEGGTSRVRVNGTVVISGSTSASLASATVQLFLGGGVGGAGQFKGWVKEMAIWNDGTAANCASRCAALA